MLYSILIAVGSVCVCVWNGSWQARGGSCVSERCGASLCLGSELLAGGALGSLRAAGAEACRSQWKLVWISSRTTEGLQP